MNRFFQKMAETLWINGFCKSRFIPSKIRYRFYRLGGIKIKKSTVREAVTFDGLDITIHQNVFINRDVFINCREHVEIGENAGIAFGTMILTATHEIGDSTLRVGPHYRRPVKIGRGVWIGARSIILPGVTLGDGCVIAAGSVVNRDCEPDCLYAGVPAKKIRTLEK